MDLIFALKALVGIVGFAIGLVIGSLISAIWLRLAAQWLRFSHVPYLTAFKCALISNFVVFTFNFSISVNHALTVAMFGQVLSKGRSRTVDLAFASSPMYILHATIFGLLVTAAIFCRTIPKKETDVRISFGDSLVLSSLYFAMSFAFMLVLALLAFCIATGLLALIGG